MRPHVKKLLWLCLCIALLGCTHEVEKPSPEVQARVAHGKALYLRMCAVCHGSEGQGYWADQAPALAQPYFQASVTDEFLRTAITHGRTGSTMSAWGRERGGPLSPADIDAIIAFLHTWKHTPPARLNEAPLGGDVSKGQRVYEARCQTCHGRRGNGGPNVSVGNQELLSTASNGYLRFAIEHGRPGTVMPAFKDTLRKDEIEDVVALLRSWHVVRNPIARRFQKPVRPPPLPLGPVPLNPKGPPPAGFKKFPDLTPLAVVKRELDRGARMALLDARAPTDYTREHIAGAVSVPFYDPDPYVEKLPKDTWLVCYCSCPHAESSSPARALQGKGFDKVTVLDEGLNVWHRKGYPIHTGEQP